MLRPTIKSLNLITGRYVLCFALISILGQAVFAQESSSSPGVDGVRPDVSTSTTLSSSPNPSTYGGSVTFTARVSPSAATGTVTFYDGGSQIGSSGMSSGTATFITSTLTGGSHSISAEYMGNGMYSPSYSNTVTQVVNKASATVTLSNLTQTYTGSALTPTAITNPSGLSISWSGAPDTNAGSYSVTATINSTNYQGSSSGTFVISKATAAVTLSNMTQTYTGSALTPTANTTPSGLTITWTGAPDTNVGSYSVTATVNNSNYQGSNSGTFVISKATATVQLSNMTQTYTGSPLTPTATTTPSGLSVNWTGAPDTNVGNYSVTATVNSSNYQGSASGTFGINSSSGSVSLQSSLNPSQYNNSVTLTATVSPGTATGTVTFFDFSGNITLGSGAISSGHATLTISTLAPGMHSITATYNGDSNNNPSTSGVFSQTVNRRAMTIPSYCSPL